MLLFLCCTCCSALQCPCRDRLYIFVYCAREGKLVIVSRDGKTPCLMTREPSVMQWRHDWLWDPSWPQHSRPVGWKCSCLRGLHIPHWLCRATASLSALTCADLPATTDCQMCHPVASVGCCHSQRGCSGRWAAGKAPCWETDLSDEHFSCRLINVLPPWPHSWPTSSLTCDLLHLGHLSKWKFAGLKISWWRCMSISYSEW